MTGFSKHLCSKTSIQKWQGREYPVIPLQHGSQAEGDKTLPKEGSHCQLFLMKWSTLRLSSFSDELQILGELKSQNKIFHLYSRHTKGTRYENWYFKKKKKDKMHVCMYIHIYIHFNKGGQCYYSSMDGKTEAGWWRAQELYRGQLHPQHPGLPTKPSIALPLWPGSPLPAGTQVISHSCSLPA